MARLILRAEPRTIVGKRVRQLRRAGKVPGVVYGPGVGNGTIQVAVDQRELERAYMTFGHSTLLDLAWNGHTQQVFIREVQLDPIKGEPLHVDFYAPNLQREVVASVPIILHFGEEKPAGIVTQLHPEIEVRALPTLIPHQLDVDASQLRQIGDVLRVSDVKLPEGVTAVTPPDEVIATVAEAEEVPEAAEGTPAS